MATKKSDVSENNPKNDAVVVSTAKTLSKESLSKEIDFVIQTIGQLDILTDPKVKQNMTLNDVLTISRKVSTVCARKLKDIKDQI
jgi:hypothetical protein